MSLEERRGSTMLNEGTNGTGSPVSMHSKRCMHKLQLCAISGRRWTVSDAFV